MIPAKKQPRQCMQAMHQQRSATQMLENGIRWFQDVGGTSDLLQKHPSYSSTQEIVIFSGSLSSETGSASPRPQGPTLVVLRSSLAANCSHH